MSNSVFFTNKPLLCMTLIKDIATMSKASMDKFLDEVVGPVREKLLNRDNFEIHYIPDEINFNGSVNEIFGIKANHGLIFRKCPICGIFNILDGKTWDNYQSYCSYRMVVESSNNLNFCCKFSFDCPDPIAPNQDKLIGTEVKKLMKIGENWISINSKKSS